MMLHSKTLTPSEVERLWEFYQSKDKNEDLLDAPTKLVWELDSVIEFEFDGTFCLEETPV